MPGQNRQNQRFHAPATRKHVRGVWRKQAVNDARNVSLAEHAQDQGQVAHRTDLLHCDRHDESPSAHFYNGLHHSEPEHEGIVCHVA